jgi:hypothetical protein
MSAKGAAHSRSLVSAVIVLMSAFVAAGDGSPVNAADWKVTSIANVGSDALRQEAKENEDSTAVNGSYPELMAETASVALAGAGTGKAYAVVFPVEDALGAIALESRGGATEATGRLTIDPGPLMSADGQKFVDKLAFAPSGRADGTLSVAYVHPGPLRLVVWKLQEAGHTGVQRSYALPWDGKNANPSRAFYYGAAAWDADRQKVHVAVARNRGATHMATLATDGGSWTSRLLSPETLVQPHLACPPGGGARLFYLDNQRKIQPGNGLPMSLIYIAEFEGRPVDITDPMEPPFGTGYFVTVDAKGAAHIVYGGQVWSGTRLLHWYESEGGWRREQLDYLKFASQELVDAEPVITDMRPSACFDRDGAMHIAYFDYVENVMKHATNQGGKWRIERVASAGGVASTSIIATDEGLMIAFVDVLDGKVLVATKSKAPDGTE